MERENWGSRFGFIMAAAGFSIGLGNIWRFPYLVGVYGGGAFVLLYLLICLLISIPLFTMEMSLGRKTQLNAVEGMRSLTKKGSPWVSFAWLGVIAAFLILTYYVQIMGWILIYLFKVPSGSFKGLDNEGFATAFSDITANTGLITGATLACLIMVGLISVRGLEKGIETASKFLMPALFVILFILVARSMTLPGAMEGLKWYLTVDWSAINGEAVLAALGQSFFSIGIASGGAFIYGSYLNKTNKIPEDAFIIVGLDTFAAFVVGLVIFPAIFALGLEPDSGPNLLFVTMSNLFTNMPGGSFFGALFFILLFFAAISSAIGYLEPVVMTLNELFKIKRARAVVYSLLAIFIVGMPNILAHGLWSHILIGERNLFDFTDYLSGNVMMPLGALVLSLYTLFVWKFEKYQEDTNLGSTSIKVYNWWAPLVKFVIPIALIAIFISGII